MGKASSSKKVARAARAGATTKSSERRELGFPLAVAVTIILGSALVLYARSDDASAVEPKIGTHWHAAYGIYNCDKWEPPVQDNGQDPHGIHTHDADATAEGGIMHVHPFDSSAGGSKATLGVFFETLGVKVSNDKIELPSGTVLQNGAKCGDKDAVLQIVRFDAPGGASASPDNYSQAEVYTKDFTKIRYREDREAFTIALVPEGTTVPKPTSISQLDQLSDLTDSTGATGASGAGGTGASGTGASGTGASGAATTTAVPSTTVVTTTTTS